MNVRLFEKFGWNILLLFTGSQLGAFSHRPWYIVSSISTFATLNTWNCFKLAYKEYLSLEFCEK